MLKILVILITFSCLFSCNRDLRMPDDFDFILEDGSSKWSTQDSTFVQKGGGKITVSLTVEERHKIWDSLVQNDFVGIPENFDCTVTHLPTQVTNLTVYHAKKV